MRDQVLLDDGDEGTKVENDLAVARADRTVTLPESTLTTAWCATVLTWTQILAAAWLEMTECTVLCTKPSPR